MNDNPIFELFSISEIIDCQQICLDPNFLADKQEVCFKLNK